MTSEYLGKGRLGLGDYDGPARTNRRRALIPELEDIDDLSEQVFQTLLRYF